MRLSFGTLLLFSSVYIVLLVSVLIFVFVLTRLALENEQAREAFPPRFRFLNSASINHVDLLNYRSYIKENRDIPYMQAPS